MTEARQTTEPAEATVPRTGLDVPVWFSGDGDKRRWYGRDTYFIECLEQLQEIIGNVAADADNASVVEDFAHRHTLLLLKPDAVVTRRLLPALEWLTDNGFRVVAAERVALTRTLVRAIWYFQWNLATAHRRRLAHLLVSASDSLVLVVRAEDQEGRTGPGEQAPARLTRLKGPTDPARRTPGQLRYLLGRYSYLINLVHTPDDPADVVRELGIYFGEDARAAVLTAALTGDDLSWRARELARQLYAETPARDVDVDTSLARLREAVASGADPAPADPATADPGRLLEAAWRARVPMDPWDVLVVGAEFLPMSREGWRPALGDARARGHAPAREETFERGGGSEQRHERGDLDVLQ